MKTKILDKKLATRIARDFPEYTMDFAAFTTKTTITNPEKEAMRIRRKNRQQIMKEMKKLNGNKRVVITSEEINAKLSTGE